MNSKIVSSVFAVAALGILFYDVCAGERVAPRAYILSLIHISEPTRH